jgi:branched-chain amino acid transport system ATP-binding protein
MRVLRRDPGDVLRMAAWVSALAGLLALGFALAPPLWLAISFNALIVMALAVIGPSLLTALSLAIPPRARSLGFSIGSLWILPGLVVLPFIGWVADRWGVRQGMVVMVPVFLAGAAVVHSAGALMARDIEQVRLSAATRAEALVARERGEAALLVVRDLHVAYGSGDAANHVVTGVDLDLAEGQIVALLGTNGAGKSTLLRAISGLTEAHRGAVIFDGRDITHAPPEEIARLGIVQLPGGRGVFGSLTVAENLAAAEWLTPAGAAGLGADPAPDPLARFPMLAARRDEPAANLSGGQQQMLALAMALRHRPRLLLLDELSLGLAPSVVAELLPVVREAAAGGVAVVVVEQSVNVALAIADTAYFLERGEIRFHGPTAELLDRPELLRSVFLGGAASPSSAPPSSVPVATPVPAPQPTPSRPLLELVAVTRRFGGVEAVSEVDLAIAAGSITGVIGANGAGKTTLFDLISGFVTLSSGRILLDGVDLGPMSAAERARAGLGRSFQDARLFPSLTVEETIAVALERFVASRDPISAALRMPWSYDSERAVALRVHELVELLGLGHLRRHLVRELSTGSRRIVDLACVVAHRPLVLLLDEPSSGIAQRETEALAPVLRRLRDDMGTTLVVIEHDIPLLVSIADRLVALDQGQVIADGCPDDVVNDSRVVASYLGTDAAAIARSGGRPHAASPRID